MAAIDEQLKRVMKWFCMECNIHFACAWPPVCPRCKQSELHAAWLENQRRSEAAYWEIRQKHAEAEKARREKWEAEAEQRAAERKTRNDFIIKTLNDAGVPLPEDEKAYGYAHLWLHRSRIIVNFFKRYNSWAGKVPSLVAARQAKWEINRQIVLLRKRGLSPKEIGQIVDLSSRRVQTIYGHDKWHSQYRLKGWYPKSPVETWLEERDWLPEMLDQIHKNDLKALKRLRAAQQWGEVIS